VAAIASAPFTVVVVVMIIVVVAIVVVAAVGLAERATMLELALLTLRAVEVGLAVHRAAVFAIVISAVRLAEGLAMLEFTLLVRGTIEVGLAGSGGRICAGWGTGRKLRRAHAGVAATVS
jgi:hypothetical protein